MEPLFLYNWSYDAWKQRAEEKGAVEICCPGAFDDSFVDALPDATSSVAMDKDDNLIGLYWNEHRDKYGRLVRAAGTIEGDFDSNYNI